MKLDEIDTYTNFFATRRPVIDERVHLHAGSLCAQFQARFAGPSRGDQRHELRDTPIANIQEC